MAALPSDRVYRGFWTDFTQGPVLGVTITTTADNANLVVAMLSLVVAFTGSHLWDLIAFATYSKGISKRPRPAFHHQRQLLARNMTSPGAFAFEMVKIGWAWRLHGPWACLALVTILSMICSVGFMIAGIFVSVVVSNSGIQVLAQSASCGFLSWQNTTASLHREYQEAVFNQAVNYAEVCYNKTTDLPQCNLYAQSNIPVQYATDVECPFSGFCDDHTAFSLDSGLLDSQDTFGINTPSDIRVQMQRVITCAPLDHFQFFTMRPVPSDILRKFDNRDPLPGELLYEWTMGLLTAKDRPYNSTFWMSNYTSAFSRIYDLTPRAFYAPATSNTSVGWHQSTFTPISAFRKDFADTHILAVQNDGVLFWTPNEDPIFAAHKPISVAFDDNSNRTMYVGDNPAGFLACAEQFKFCFSQGNCTALLGIDQAYYQGQRIAPTFEQNVTLHYLFSQTPTWYSITTAPMQVTKNAASFQLGIPPYQWRIEMFAWMNFLLAITQTSITHLAAGPGIVREDFDQSVEPLQLPSLCHSQRMRAPDGYSNINVLGLTFVIALFVAVTIANLTLLPLLKYLHVHKRRYSSRIRSWTGDGMLQLLRKAYEKFDVPGWSSTDSDVPVLNDNRLIPALSTETGSLDTENADNEGQVARQSQTMPRTASQSEGLSLTDLTSPTSPSRRSAISPITNSSLPTNSAGLLSSTEQGHRQSSLSASRRSTAP